MLLWVVFNTVQRESRQTLCEVKLDVRVSWQRTSWKWLFMNVYSVKVQRWEVPPRLVQFTIHSLWVSTNYHTKCMQREKRGGQERTLWECHSWKRYLFIYLFFSKLRRVLLSKSLRKDTKITIFNACVKSVLLYGCETWLVTKDIQRKIQTFGE